jgi:hypothetical protein
MKSAFAAMYRCPSRTRAPAGWLLEPVTSWRAAWPAPTSPVLKSQGGVYLEDCEIAEIVDPDAPDAMKAGPHPHAADTDPAARLWTISADRTGVDALGGAR